MQNIRLFSKRKSRNGGTIRGWLHQPCDVNNQAVLEMVNSSISSLPLSLSPLFIFIIVKRPLANEPLTNVISVIVLLFLYIYD